MPTNIARLFGCCTQPDTLEQPSPTQNSSAPKVLPRHARLPVGHIDLSRDLMEAGVELAHDKLRASQHRRAAGSDGIPRLLPAWHRPSCLGD